MDRLTDSSAGWKNSLNGLSIQWIHQIFRSLIDFLFICGLMGGLIDK